MLQLARFGATHLDAIICPGDGQYAIVDAGSAVAEELLSVAVLDLLRWVLFISFEMQSSDAAMGEWLQWVGSRLRASSWRTRSSPIAERASHSAFAWEISPRSKTTGFNPSDGDMLSRRIGLIHPIVLGRPRARETTRQTGFRVVDSLYCFNAGASRGASRTGGRPLKPNGRHLDRGSHESTTQGIPHPTLWLRACGPGLGCRTCSSSGSCQLSLRRPPTFSGPEISEIFEQRPPHRPS